MSRCDFSITWDTHQENYSLSFCKSLFLVLRSPLLSKQPIAKKFQDMHGNWSIRANAPGENLLVEISVQHPELGDYFVATLKAKRVSSQLMSDQDMFFWLMPHKVAFWIYWHVSVFETLLKVYCTKKFEKVISTKSPEKNN